MKIKLSEGRMVPSGACQALQVALGCELSKSLTNFLQKNDGAKPETNIFKIDGKNNCGVSRFIPASEILKERTRIENIPEKAYPVAWADGGNYVFVNEDKGGAVFFWDHEVPENIVQLAPNFGQFLDLLEPLDIRKIKLKPGQVKKVWVDPEFLKRLKNK
jgi:hypothetical protein